MYKIRSQLGFWPRPPDLLLLRGRRGRRGEGKGRKGKLKVKGKDEKRRWREGFIWTTQKFCRGARLTF